MPADPAIDPTLRLAARRLRDELVRTHPSFRFEERLARRLAEAAARMRLATAAGGEAEATVIPFPAPLLADPALAAELANPQLAALFGAPYAVAPADGTARDAADGGAIESGPGAVAASPVAASSRAPADAAAWPFGPLRGAAPAGGQRPDLRRAVSGGCGVRGVAADARRAVRPDGSRGARCAGCPWDRPGRSPAADRRGVRRGRPAAAPEARLMPFTLPFRPRRESYPPDMWTKCPSCSEMLFNKHLEKNLRVCGTCGHHFRISARTRLDQLLDAGTFRERDEGLVSRDPLGFVDSKPYVDRLVAAQLSTGRRDGATWGFGALGGRRVAICALDFGFMGGSMGSVVGEKVTRAAEGALAERVPLIVVSSSGGARMQEGTLALMQLVKTIGALERLRAAGLLYISVLADPTTGGVFASFAALGDVNVAEPNALIGFAGARVSAGTIAEELPPGFQRAEFLFSHGFVDRIVTRADLRDELALLLDLLRPAGDARRRVRERSPWLTGCWAARAIAKRCPRPAPAAGGSPRRGLGPGPAGPQRASPAHPGAGRPDHGVVRGAPR